MGRAIDCVLIGHNEMVFRDYEKKLRYLGTGTPSYRELNLGFVKYKDEPYTATDVFNTICQNTDYVKDGAFRWDDVFSLAIACIATYLDKHGVSFDYISEFQSGKEQLRDMLENDHVLTVGITTTFYTTAEPIIEIVKFIRSINKDAKIIIGGIYITGEAKTQTAEFINNHFRQIGADYYISSSQGEDALQKLIKRIKENRAINGVPNIYYRDNEKYGFTFAEEENNALKDNLVNWGLFSDRIRKTIAVRTARSCPFSCSYCAFPLHAGKYETLDCGSIDAEFKAISGIKGLEYINFTDDSFNVPMNRFKEILRSKISNNHNFKWNSFIRCQYLDEESVELMKESGCEGVFLGIESANQKILKIMNKNVEVGQHARGIEMLNKHGIITYASFIFGMPGETVDSVNDTIEFIRVYKPDFYRIQLWFCDPITPIWQQREEFGLTGTNFAWKHGTMTADEAQSHIERAFLEIDDSLWLPQFNFDFTAIFNLLHRGLDLQQIKKYIQTFNEGVRAKLRDMDAGNISDGMFADMKAALRI